MITRIGIIAGEIWSILDKKGEMTLSEIYDYLEYHNDHILMSVGWLAREGHIILNKEKEDYKITLRKI